jgi:hypothetical protein
MAALMLRIFGSSPGDVDEERRRATRVLHRLQGEFARFCHACGAAIPH